MRKQELTLYILLLLGILIVPTATVLASVNPTGIANSKPDLVAGEDNNLQPVCDCGDLICDPYCFENEITCPTDCGGITPSVIPMTPTEPSFFGGNTPTPNPTRTPRPTLTPNTPTPCPDVRINEIRIDQPGDTEADPEEFFELVGAPGTELDGLTYIVLGDRDDRHGVIEVVVDLAGQTIPSSGFFVTAEGTFTLGEADLVRDLNFEDSDNVTHMLVCGFTGFLNNALDFGNNGTLDIEPWTAIVDLIAVIEEENPPVNTEYHYGPPVVGPVDGTAPPHTFRCPDEVGDFRPAPLDPQEGFDSPGAANICDVTPGEVPEDVVDIFVLPEGCGFVEFEDQPDDWVTAYRNTSRPETFTPNRSDGREAVVCEQPVTGTICFPLPDDILSVVDNDLTQISLVTCQDARRCDIVRAPREQQDDALCVTISDANPLDCGIGCALAPRQSSLPSFLRPGGEFSSVTALLAALAALSVLATLVILIIVLVRNLRARNAGGS